MQSRIVRVLLSVLLLAGIFAFNPLKAQTVQAISDDIVISQVYGGGGNSGATYTHDYIELFNRGTIPFSVAGWSVQYGSAAGTTWQVTTLSGTIPPGGYYLVQEAQGAGGTVPLPTPDATGTILMSATAAKVALVKGTVALSGACPGGWVDLVGYGVTNCFEGSATAVLSNTTAAKRNDHGCSDTDNNSVDFTVANPTLAPSPRNSATTPAPCEPVGSPNLSINDVSVVEGNSGTILATFTISLSSPAGVGGVTFDIATADNTATVADNDYVLGSFIGQTIAAGHSSAQFSVTVNGDTNTESSETFHANITNVSGATVLDAQGVGTIIDDDTLTPIYTIQGSSATTPMPGATVTTSGVVVSDDEGPSPALRGFFLQDPFGDGNPATSDGIFIYNGNNNSVSVGDFVVVTGTVSEFEGQTQISAANISPVTNLVLAVFGPTDITLPFASAAEPEQYEGMLVRFAQTLYVTDTYLLGRFGEVTLSSSSRLPQPTNIVLPGAPALALQAANYLNQIIVDDPLNNQNPDPILFARGGNPLSMSNTLRGGDVLINPVGVLTYTWSGNSDSPNAYRLRPVNALMGGIPNFLNDNSRPAAHTDVGGEVKVAGMNLLNYFNTFGTGACSNGVGGTATDCRGANNITEFTRQADKLVNAIAAINPDVLGIVEMENDGYGSSSAIQDLVNRLNTKAGATVYAFLDVDTLAGKVNALGTDAIKVGLIYKPANVTPVGTTAVLDSIAFVNGEDSTARNRVSLLQAFRTNNNEVFLVNVNHLKSKGSACDTPDANDGQGNCNLVRLNAVNALKTWFATNPTGTGDSDLLVLGDLNSYAMEDPIAAFESGGFTNLIKLYNGTDAYSYSFDGQWGYLDHALATSTMLPQVSGITEWHINADEPSVLDYNTEYKTAGQLVSLYSTEPYRAGDHDPIVVGLDLTSPGVFGKISPANGASGVSISPTLSWGASSGATGYEYCLDSTNNNTCDGDWTSAGNNTSVGPNLVGYASTYYWQVRAVNGGDLTYADGGTWWSFSTVPPLPSAFSKVTPVNGATNVTTSPNLTWGTADYAASYEYCIDSVEGATCEGAWVSVGSETSVQMVDLSTSTTFYWQVRAVNITGSAEANSGTWWSFTTVPSKPTAFVKFTPTYTASDVPLNPTLSWDFSIGAAWFEYCIDTSNNSYCDTSWVNNGLNANVQLSNLLPSTTYYWQVKASNAGGDTYANGGTWWPFTTLSVPPGAFTKISPPNNVVGVSTTNALAWGTSSYATSYEYCLDKTDNDTCDGSWVSAGSNLSASPVMAKGTKYYWQVKAVSPGGNTLADGGTWWNFTTPSSFTDIYDSHWALTWIERLYNSGITTGCNPSPLQYCPEDTVTRSQMAVFLIRATHGVSFVPPDPTGIFTDVPTTAWAANYIEQLYADGITTGCNPSPLMFCPTDSVTRAQMAAFLLRAKHGASYIPPLPTGIFSDVPTTYWAAAWIEQLYAEGITTGCNTGLYCPEQSVTRAQMAAFLVRTFALP